jgi:hypothetical protein
MSTHRRLGAARRHVEAELAARSNKVVCRWRRQEAALGREVALWQDYGEIRIERAFHRSHKNADSVS